MGPDDDDDGPRDRGRTQQQRAARAYDALAIELVELPPNRYKGLPMTTRLREGLEQARRTASKPARRRHAMHIAGILRESELEVRAIRAYLAGKPFVRVKGDEDYRDLAALREALCDSEQFDNALERVRSELPHADTILLQRLARECHEGENDKSFRAIYKELNRALEESEAADD